MDKEPEPKRPRVGDDEANALSYPLELFHSDPRNEALHAESLRNPEKFWEDLAKRRIRWMKAFDCVRQVDMNTGSIKWFLGGQLNVSGMYSLSVETFVYSTNDGVMLC